VEATALQFDSWTIDGPHFKDADSYLSHDGTNPEAPSPGYGWPLGTECWYYELEGRRGWERVRLCATGLTRESAAQRAQAIMASDDPGAIHRSKLLMPTVLHIDGLSTEPTSGTIEPGESLYDLVKRWGGTIRTEYVPELPKEPRELMTDAEEFIRTYEYEDSGSVLAVVRRYGWLDAEEFDTAEEAKRFIEIGEDYGSLAGEAIVDGDKIEVWD
jgi:hypothetical protein